MGRPYTKVIRYGFIVNRAKFNVNVTILELMVLGVKKCKVISEELYISSLKINSGHR